MSCEHQYDIWNVPCHVLGVVQQMQAMWGIDEARAHALYGNLAIYTHGLATLLMAGAKLSDDELKAGMDEVFYALAASLGIDFERAPNDKCAPR